MEDASSSDAAVDLDGGSDASAEPDAAPESNDPFDDSSCAGPGITFAEAAAKFPGVDPYVVLAPYALRVRERICNDANVCTPWGEPRIATAKHLGGNTTGDFSLVGDFELIKSNGHFEVTPMDASIFEPNYTSLRFPSATTVGPLVFPTDSAYRYTAQNNSFIPPSPVHDGLPATFVLNMTSSCARVHSLDTTATGPATTQYAFLVRY